ncbi:MAG: pre-peptidase C-terminal domain-containing protein [Actinomycetota bacterium]
MGANISNFATDEQTCPPVPEVLNCDVFTLTVDVPTSAYLPTGAVTITITWADANNDFDMYVYNEAGEVAGSSAGPTNIETVTLPRATGTYMVSVNGFAVVNSGYEGPRRYRASRPPKRRSEPARERYLLVGGG